MKTPKPYRRAGHRYLVRRVPADLALLDPRGTVQISTKIRIADDPRGVRAALAVRDLNQNLERYWRDLRTGGGAEAQARYDEVRSQALSLGFSYAPAGELATRGLEEIIGRVETLLTGKRLDDTARVAATLGGVVAPRLLLSGLLEAYEAHMLASLSDLSPDQLRKWRNPLRRTIENLTRVIGDKSIGAITRDDALDFRDWWQFELRAKD